MDPFSLCASTLTTITAAESGLNGLRKVKQYWKAPEDTEKLNQEMESLQSTLRDVAEFVESSSSALYCANLA